MDRPNRKPLPASSPILAANNSSVTSPQTLLLATTEEISPISESSSQPAAHQSCSTTAPVNNNGGQGGNLIPNEQEQPGPETVESSYSKACKISHQNRGHNPWNTLWLGSGALIAFTVLFGSLLVSLLLLLGISQRLHGIASQRGTNQYALKYGPTAGILP
jgi:hypothetical protein